MAFNKEKALKEAEKLVAKNKDRDAIKLYQEIAKNDPRDLNSLNKVGDLQLKIGEKAGALESYSQIAEKYANDGFNLRAIAMYKKCQRVDPARIDYVEKLAELNAQQGLTNEAKANFTQVAEHYMREGKGQKARAVYARIAEIEPDNLKNRLKLADLYLKENQLQQALGEYRVIGAELAKKGMLDESLQVLDKALGLDPGNIEILRAVARTRVDMGRADEGIRFIGAKNAEKGNQDPDLLLVLGETLQAAGHHDHARQAFERAAHFAPDRPDVTLALFRLTLDQGDVDGAIAHYARITSSMIQAGRGAQVVDDLKAILRVRESHVPTLERLLQVQIELGGDSKVQSDWMSRLAEAYIAQGRYGDAEHVLTRLVAMEPDVSQHGEKLEFVRIKLRSGDGGATPTAAAMPAAAETSFGSFSEGGDDAGFSMSFGEDELESESSRGDDRAEFITERTAEADVFIKYGLVDKAIEQLQAVIARHADDVPTRQKLAMILRDEGRAADAAEQFVAIASIAQQKGDESAARQALLAAQQVAPAHPAVVRALGAAPAAAAQAPAPAPAFQSAPAAAPSFAGGFDLSLDDDVAPAPEPTWGAPQPAAAAPAASNEFELSLDSGEDTSLGSFGSPSPAAPAPAAAASGGEFEISLDDGGTSSNEFELSVDDDAAPSGGFALSSEPAEEAAGEFEIAMDEEPAPAAAAASSGGEFDIEVDESEGGFDFGGTSEADDSGGGFAFGAPAEPEQEAPAPVATPAPMADPAPPQPVAASAPEPPAEEGLFGEEDDFFNFADEINKELESQEGLTEVSRGDDRGMTLEEIVSGIQKGVAAQVDKSDYETHYNLGIAYKEMGLQDEAIGEFQYASKDPTLFLSCCIYLGACFTEKGMPELAISWYEKGKASAQGITEEDRIALDYEIAHCHEAMGEDSKALQGFMGIYGMDSRYRDVSQRVARLKQATGR
jgi:pilus assembly protein FimV